jgi:hypothetical protein
VFVNPADVPESMSAGFFCFTGGYVSKQVFYKQCRLQKGDSHQVSWIPEQFAVRGKILKLRDDAGIWDNGWEVKGAGSHRVESHGLLDAHQIIKSHRQATGDALPK